ncbi:Alkylated DNA repair protein alkB 8 [Heracleum sosnowskyi]|uniref:Alkylated DNA repair protein alkB 8 n=1 Tax=Heracleum sosnowskyi TaxID=360622 RepID=A0AAD8IVC9_9APIA|nr:Alkylated DNA repair protein alkB 8 [Heracleum sosnowskyi]
MSGFKTCGSSNLDTSLLGVESIAREEQSVPASPILKECVASSVQSTPEIEKKYVHRVYDAIAPHFSSTRFAKWPKVATFLNSLAPGSLILDAGCGNGKYLGLTPDSVFIGCDISAPLVGICADRGNEVVVADAVNLPYRSGYGDAAISIAVLHHLSTEIRRKKAIDELVRVVKRGGLVLITVWAVEQEDKTLLNKWTPLTDKYVDEWIGPGSPRTRSSSPFSLGSSSSFTLESIPEAEENGLKEKLNKFRDSSSAVKGSENGLVASEGQDHFMDFEAGEEGESHQEYFVPWHLPYHRAEVSGASVGAVASGLAKKDDKKGAIVYNRYYHVFSQGELERLVSGMKNAVVVDRFYDKSNWCIILRRTE